jgi:hypothetical protein
LSQHYNVDLKQHSVDLAEDGVAMAEMILETKDLWDENDPWARCLLLLLIFFFLFLGFCAFIDSSLYIFLELDIGSSQMR